MRFKSLHKMYDYGKRFNEGENMCVGCGRCVGRCSQDISFIETINTFHDELEKAKHGFELSQNDKPYITVCARQMGVGGYDSWGARTLKEHENESGKNYSLGFSLIFKNR